MRKSSCVFLLAAALLLVTGSAFATTDWLVDPTFDVQRDAYWDFEAGLGTPPTYWGPAQYAGPDDPILMPGDWTAGGGCNVLGPYLGIDNTAGVNPTGGGTQLHFTNWPEPNPIKLIWFQYDEIESGGGTVALSIYSDYGQAAFEEIARVENPDGSVTVLNYAVIMPNPPFETFNFSFFAPVGGVAGIDNVRVATACVPEPSMIGLVAFGVLSILARRKK